jgi:hypothetical protein
MLPEADPILGGKHLPFQTLIPMSSKLHSLCQDDLNIKRYVRTLASVAVQENGSAGDIVHWTTSQHRHVRENGVGLLVAEHTQGIDCKKGHGCMDTVKRFSLDNAGRLRLDDDRNAITLSDLPEHLCTQI